MKQTKDWEKEFEETYGEYIKNISIAQYDENGVNIGYINAEAYIRKFIKSLLTQQKKEIVEMITLLKKEKIKRNSKPLGMQTKMDMIKERVGNNSYNEAIETIINLLNKE